MAKDIQEHCVWDYAFTSVPSLSDSGLLVQSRVPPHHSGHLGLSWTLGGCAGSLAPTHAMPGAPPVMTTTDVPRHGPGSLGGRISPC